MIIRRALLLVALVTLGGCVHRAAGVSGSVWELRGAVVTITPELLTVRHKTGQLVPLAIDDQTVFIRDHARESAAALRPGVRITIIVETSPQHVYRARQVEIFGRR
jgi:hypothetical protein